MPLVLLSFSEVSWSFWECDGGGGGDGGGGDGGGVSRGTSDDDGEEEEKEASERPVEASTVFCAWLVCAVSAGDSPTVG